MVLLHDATLDCRTDGSGAPEDYTLSELLPLDLGFGYTYDQGQRYPFRGKGLGLVTTLEEVFLHFPGKSFVIDIKRGQPEDGERVAEVLSGLSEVDRLRQSVYGGARAVARVAERLPEVLTFDAGRVKSCMKEYILTGWAGHLDASCAHTYVLIPANMTWMIGGFPRRFERRLGEVGSAAVVMGPLIEGITTGLDEPAQWERLSSRFEGWIWTNKIEVIGPLVKAGR